MAAQQNGRCGCYSTKRRKTDGDDGPNESIVILQLLNGHRDRHRHNDKYVSVSTGVLSNSIHIQLFSQNQSLLIPIENQNITKRVKGSN